MFSISKSSPIPLHTQLLNELRHAILSGKLKPHERLPGEYALITDLHVSRSTVQRAWQTAQDEGLIYRIPAKGTFVSPPPATRPVSQFIGCIVAEFRDTFDGVCKWQILFDNASRDVCQQMDLGHCMLAGEDPSFWLKKYPARNPAVHVKAVSKTTGVVGADGADWEKTFAACEADITEWYVVEAEVHPDALDDVRGCIDFMKQKGRA